MFVLSHMETVRWDLSVKNSIYYVSGNMSRPCMFTKEREGGKQQIKFNYPNLKDAILEDYDKY